MPANQVSQDVETTGQRGLFGGESLPSLPPSPVPCVGGCGESLVPGATHNTPGGWMCARCFADLYTECADCGKMLRYDHWGECDDLRIGPDELHRCTLCDCDAFSVCACCGRRTTRSNGGEVCFNPRQPIEEYCRPCWDGNWFTCITCNDVFERSECYYSPRGNEHYCESCFEENYFRCSGCGGSFSLTNMHGWSEDPFCENCFGRADIWKVQPWSGRATTFNQVGSERRFGVELETSHSGDHVTLHGQTEWGCVYECSTPGREFVSPILQGDEGFSEIRTMCEIAADRNWAINTACGLHIHLDARDLSNEEMLQIAYAYRKTYSLWRRLVGSRRSGNSMCGSPQYNLDDIRNAEHIEDFIEARDRFEFVNWRSFLCHGSIEIRLYKGSLNAREICNWIALHTRFIDAAKNLTFDEIEETFKTSVHQLWAGLFALVNDSNLLDYWRRIAGRHDCNLPALWSDTDDSEPVDDSVDDSDDDSDDEFTHIEEAREALHDYGERCRQTAPAVCEGRPATPTVRQGRSYQMYQNEGGPVETPPDDEPDGEECSPHTDEYFFDERQDVERSECRSHRVCQHSETSVEMPPGDESSDISDLDISQCRCQDCVAERLGQTTDRYAGVTRARLPDRGDLTGRIEEAAQTINQNESIFERHARRQMDAARCQREYVDYRRSVS